MRVPRPLRWLLWPATVAHELTHALLAVLFGCTILEVRLRDEPRVRYRVARRRVVPVVVNVGPMVIGLVLGGVAYASGAESALAARRPVLWGLLVLWWIRYTLPSGDDLQPLLHAGDTLSVHGE